MILSPFFMKMVLLYVELNCQQMVCQNMPDIIS